MFYTLRRRNYVHFALHVRENRHIRRSALINKIKLKNENSQVPLKTILDNITLQEAKMSQRTNTENNKNVTTLKSTTTFDFHILTTLAAFVMRKPERTF